MKTLLEKMWNEFFAEECAVIDTEAEKSLQKKALDLHKAINKALTAEQNETIEKYIEAFCDLQSSFVKKAFFKGCAFTVAFLFETFVFPCEQK